MVDPGKPYPKEVKIRAVKLYAEYGSYRKVADELGVGWSTVSKWTKDPKMIPYMDDHAKSVVGALEGYALRAIETLGDVLEDDEATVSQKINAAKTILDSLARHKQADLQKTVAEAVKANMISGLELMEKRALMLRAVTGIRSPVDHMRKPTIDAEFNDDPQ